MDLGTVKKYLKDSKYTTCDEVLDDLQLIWTNCKTYNMEGSEIWKIATQLEKQTNKLLEKTFKVSVKDIKKHHSVKEEESVRDNNDDEGEDKAGK